MKAMTEFALCYSELTYDPRVTKRDIFNISRANVVYYDTIDQSEEYGFDEEIDQVVELWN